MVEGPHHGGCGGALSSGNERAKGRYADFGLHSLSSAALNGAQGYETAISLRELLQEEQIDNRGHNKTKENPYEFFVSDAAERFKAFANSILPFDITSTQQIQIEEF